MVLTIVSVAPARAFALPGPEVLIPVGIGAANAVRWVIAFLAGLVERSFGKGRPWVRFVVAFLVVLLVVQVARGAIVGVVVAIWMTGVVARRPNNTVLTDTALRFRKAIAIAFPVALVLKPVWVPIVAAATATALPRSRTTRVRLSTLFLLALSFLLCSTLFVRRPNPPIPTLADQHIDEWLAGERDTLALHVGYRTHFANCRAPDPLFVRTSDYPDFERRLLDGVAAGYRLDLVAEPNVADHEARALRDDPRVEHFEPYSREGWTCYAPWPFWLWQGWPEWGQLQMPEAPGNEAWPTPSTPAASGTASGCDPSQGRCRVLASEVNRLRSDALPAFAATVADGAVVEASLSVEPEGIRYRPHAAMEAIHTLRGLGVEVGVAELPYRLPTIGERAGTARVVLALVAAFLLTLLATFVGYRWCIRAEAALCWGRGDWARRLAVDTVAIALVLAPGTVFGIWLGAHAFDGAWLWLGSAGDFGSRWAVLGVHATFVAGAVLVPSTIGATRGAFEAILSILTVLVVPALYSGGLGVVTFTPAHLLVPAVAWTVAASTFRAYRALLDRRVVAAGVGQKARRVVASRATLGDRVPPVEVIAWTVGGTADALARRLRAAWGSGPVIARSTAPDEDVAGALQAGRYTSVRADLAASGLASALDEVVTSYGGTSGPAFVMPYVRSDVGGVAMTNSTGDAVEVEYAVGGAEGVTDGSVRPERVHATVAARVEGADKLDPAVPAMLLDALVRVGGAPVEGEWVARGRRWWLLQHRPTTVPDPEAEAARLGLVARLREIGVPPVPWWDGERDFLVASSDGSIPLRASERTLALWSELWTRERALGDAVELLGIPRRLAPRHLLVVGDGRLWAVAPVLARLGRVVARRIGPLSERFGSLNAAAEVAYAAPTLGPTEDLRRVAAVSLALRLVRSLLDPVSGEAPPEDVPPESATRRLMAALAEFGTDAAELPDEFLHRAAFDLDPESPRFAEASGRDVPEWTRALALPSGPTRSRLTTEWCDFLRDALHDRLAYAVHRLRSTDGSWVTAAFSGDSAAADGRRTVTAASNRLSAQALCTMGFGRDGDPEAGEWVSGNGPLEGRLTWDPEQGGPDAILATTTASPTSLRNLSTFRAVVSLTGGRLSHGALVAREVGVPALFGAGEVRGIAEGTLVRLEADGRLEVLGEAAS